MSNSAITKSLAHFLSGVSRARGGGSQCIVSAGLGSLGLRLPAALGSQCIVSGFIPSAGPVRVYAMHSEGQQVLCVCVRLPLWGGGQEGHGGGAKRAIPLLGVALDQADASGRERSCTLCSGFPTLGE